jgi:hypothetical protein
MGGACSTNGEEKSIDCKARKKETAKRSRCRWVDNRMNLGELGWGDVDWIGLAQDRKR